MTDRVADWVALVDGRFPERDAAVWDAVGLHVGDPEDPVDAVLVCLDVTDAVLAEAADLGAGLVLAHHPLLFRPLERLTPASASGRLALRAARSRIGVLAAHTNFDAARPGTTDPMVALLGLQDVRPLEPLRDAGDDKLKLVTFVPHPDTGRVLDAVAAAGAGVIGEYDHCSFRVAGTGTFRPSEAADPATGERGRLNEEPEDRLEVVLPRRALPAVREALVAVHPYEEVAYDLYPLVADMPALKGMGRVGTLPEPMPLRGVADRLANGLPSSHLRVAGDLGRTVRQVAACGGAGDSLVPAALAAGADVYVTGDLRHHVTLDALTLGMAMIDAGHHATEAAALDGLREALAGEAAARGLTARLLRSRSSTEPWADYRPHDGPTAERRP
jgi:dinuclear metal center YbgI/SA1388 family protein